MEGGGGSSYDLNSYLGAWSHVPSGKGGLCLVPCSFWVVSVQGSLCQGDPPPRETPPTVVGGTHPTGMLSCRFYVHSPFHALCFVSKCTKFPLTQMKRTRPEKSYWHIVYVFSYPQPTEKTVYSILIPSFHLLIKLKKCISYPLIWRDTQFSRQ